MIECFSCHKKITMFGERIDEEFISALGYQSPEGMSKHDKLCKSCFNNIKNTQVKSKLQLKTEKYEKELPVVENIFGSYIPIWSLIVFYNLGTKYGTLSLVTHWIMVGCIFVIIFLTSDYSDNITSSEYINPIGIAGLISIFPLHGLITWYFIKKYNARVRANKSSKTAPDSKQG